MRKIYSLVVVAFLLMAASFSIAQDSKTSVGPAPVSDVKIQQNPNPSSPLAVGSRAFTQISSSPTFQFGKSFMETCTITNIGAPFTITFPGGLMYRNGIVYTYNQSAPYQVWSIDTVTGVHTQVLTLTGVPSANLTGMVWDGTTVYGLSTSITNSQIFSINWTTGACTAIGAAQATCAGGIELFGCIGANYSLFVVDIVADNLYKFNKTTGVATLVGPLGANANFGQGGSVDPNDNKFYWMAYTTAPELRLLDTATGSSTVKCSYLAQATGLAIVPSAPPTVDLCEQFSGGIVPPTGWTLTGAATLWMYNAVSGYGFGVGSAKADFYNVATGNQQLNSITFTPSIATDTLKFQDAYCTFATENDQLQILTSTNGGTNYTQLVMLNGGVSGQLVSAPPQTASFTPTAAQWIRQKFGLPVGTNKVQFNAITAFGNNLYIDSICIKHTVSGISIYEGIPKNFSLSQNYPNPFNPVTKINFALPKSGFVTLKIYDMLGREIRTLVNEVKSAGNFSVDFNASELSSGIYFYRLETNGFSDIKKMMLIK